MDDSFVFVRLQTIFSYPGVTELIHVPFIFVSRIVPRLILDFHSEIAVVIVEDSLKIVHSYCSRVILNLAICWLNVLD